MTTDNIIDFDKALKEKQEEVLLEEVTQEISLLDDPHLFISMANQPIPVALINQELENGRWTTLAGIILPTGVFIGGFPIFPDGLDSEDLIRQILKEIPNQKNFTNAIPVTDEEGLITTYQVRPPLAIAVVDVLGEPSYDFTNTKYKLDIDCIFEVGDFVSDEHRVISAGKFSMYCDDYLSGVNLAKSFIEHAKASYDSVANALGLTTITPHAHIEYSFENGKKLDVIK